MKNMKLSTKLYVSFALVLLILAGIAANSVLSVDGLTSAGNEAVVAGAHSKFMVEKEVDHFKWIGAVKDLFLKNQSTLHVQLDPHKCGLGKFLYGEGAKKLAKGNPELAKLLEEIKIPHAELHKSAAHIKEAWQQNHPGLSLTLAARLDDHRRWAANLVESIIENQEVTAQIDPKKCAFGKWLNSSATRQMMEKWPKFAAIMEIVIKHHDRLHETAQLVKQAPTQEAKIGVYVKKTLPELQQVAVLFDQAMRLEESLNKAQKGANQIFDKQTLPALAATQGKLKKITETLSQEQTAAQKNMDFTGKQTKWIAMVVSGCGILLGILLAFFLTRSITKPINRVVDGLNAGSDQVAAASQQVSGSSQTLAEGASEQAAALEETSSSLEEMTSMIKQNADNAGQADNLMKETSQVMSGASESMHKLISAMNNITAASDETSKIIKTIDEIAFQTNLLALNAAVEAARAGDAGAGFAVVADEVRNLAMRAAEAAKNTGSLIEGNITEIKQGHELVVATEESFKQVQESAGKMGELISEISAASSEQAQGIEQINKAAHEMDKVTQQVAANAEESAAASEELSAQAETMRGYVSDLAALVGGKNGKSADRGKVKASPKAKGPRFQGMLPAPDSRAGNQAKAKNKPGGKTAARDTLPLDDEDFKDF